MERTITCRCCERPVERRSELIVAGRAFLTFHRACFFGRDGRRWRIRLGYPINGTGFWIFFLGFNAVLGIAGLVFGPDDALRHLAIWINASLLVMRGVCWVGLERRLRD
jgi:hypothetical protein